MRLVNHAAINPQHCAVLGPVIRNSNSGKGFIDTGQELVGPQDKHVYVSVIAAEKMAREILGWIPPQQYTYLTATINRQAGEIERLKHELAEAARFREAAEYTMGAMGQKVRNKPGRKPAEKQVA